MCNQYRSTNRSVRFAAAVAALVTVWMLFDLVVTLGDVRSFSPDTHATAPAYAQGVQTRTCCTV